MSLYKRDVPYGTVVDVYAGVGSHHAQVRPYSETSLPDSGVIAFTVKPGEVLKVGDEVSLNTRGQLVKYEPELRFAISRSDRSYETTIQCGSCEYAMTVTDEFLVSAPRAAESLTQVCEKHARDSHVGATVSAHLASAIAGITEPPHSADWPEQSSESTAMHREPEPVEPPGPRVLVGQEPKVKTVARPPLRVMVGTMPGGS